ncbi:hypothetical protein [Sodalis sp. RH20]|uniref:hypothetical protein n=1 Tax=unclassified Sodalis (in: enterobacteria) TaxID=2636512 RepID=UPI0039B6535C
MPDAEGGFGRWMERPWRALALAQIIVGVYVALGILLVVRPGQDAAELLRQDIGHCKTVVAGQERAQAGLPAPERLKADILRLRRPVDAGEKMRGDPAALAAVIPPGRGKNLTWRALGAAGDRQHVFERWQLVVTTDYAQLRRMLRHLCDLRGALPLETLTVRRRGGLLEAELILSAAPGTETKNGRREKAPGEAGDDDEEAGNDGATAVDYRETASSPGLAAEDQERREATDDERPQERDPFQPAPHVQPGHAGRPAADGRIDRIKGKVGAGERWLFWTVDDQGRWRRCGTTRTAARKDQEDQKDQEDHNGVTR